MPFASQVERWRSIAADELNKARVPLPVELVLSLIRVESGGAPGATNPKSGASGLLQVMPKTLDWYREQTGDQISPDELRSSTIDAARKQIRAGIWVLGQFWQSACKWIKGQTTDIPISDLARFADSFYAGGPGRVKAMAATMDRKWDAWRATYPKSNITQHAEKVWALTSAENPAFELDRIAQWIETKNDKLISSNKFGLVIGLVILLLASALLRPKESRHEQI